MRKAQLIAVVVSFLCLVSCANSPGVTGKQEEWLKGKAISAKGFFFENFGVSCELRNDSDKEVIINPIKFVYWGKRNGNHESSFSFPGGGTLRPKETVRLPTLGGDPGDLDKFTIYLGADGSPQQEVFTFTRH